MKKIIKKFAEAVRRKEIEIYNEFSLQHEIGIFLRSQLPNQKVQFERNVSFFFKTRKPIKKEIDVSVISAVRSKPQYAVELKFPRNGQYPEQMFSICKDVRFAEQLKTSGFRRTFVIVFADDPLFYSPGRRKTGVYAYFRKGKELSGTVRRKPTGKRITLRGSYSIRWTHVSGKLKYCVIEAI